jgi:tetratricopeptide (TPR) repeat protein
MVDEALSEGFVLAPHFYEQLASYEKQEQAMRLYLPEMIDAIDLKKEEARLEKVEFAKEVKIRRAKATAAQPEPLLSAAQKSIEDAEALYGEKKYDKAREAFRRVLEQSSEKPLHARAYYGLGRIAILQKENELGLKLLEKSLELEPDPYVKGWVLVYLGKLAGIAEERDKAVKYLRDALAVDGASLAARKEAQKTLQEISQR